MHVTGLGQCSLDYLTLVDSYPRVDTKKEVLEWQEQGGGPVATALVALSRLGVSCRFYGVTGDDEAGEKIRRSLAEEGVDLKGLVKRKGGSSQLAFIAIEKSTAKRTIFWRRPTGRALHPDELGEDFLAGSDFLLVDGLMMEASMSAVKRARELNIPSMLDAGSARPGMLDLAGLCDYVVASEAFAEGLGWGLKPADLLNEFKALRGRILTVTRGGSGSITVVDDRTIRMPAFTVEAVDTTGAGDVFHAGYIYGLLQGWEIERVLRFSSALAALTCKRVGGRSGAPSLVEVLEFMRAHDE